MQVDVEVIQQIEQLFKVRTPDGELVPLKANAVQRLYEERRGQRNIVKKSRQQGFTTWCVARALLRCLAKPNTSAISIAPNANSASHIFWQAAKMLGLMSSSSVLNRITMSGNSTFQVLNASSGRWTRGVEGKTIDYIHGAEIAMWPDRARDDLDELRYLFDPDGEEVMESSPLPDGAGVFEEEWASAESRGVARHFFPWWLNPENISKPPERQSLTDEECGLIVREGLTFEQIGWRRRAYGDRRYGNLEWAKVQYLEKP